MVSVVATNSSLTVRSSEVHCDSLVADLWGIVFIFVMVCCRTTIKFKSIITHRECTNTGDEEPVFHTSLSSHTLFKHCFPIKTDFFCFLFILQLCFTFTFFKKKEALAGDRWECYLKMIWVTCTPNNSANVMMEVDLSLIAVGSVSQWHTSNHGQTTGVMRRRYPRCSITLPLTCCSFTHQKETLLEIWNFLNS